MKTLKFNRNVIAVALVVRIGQSNLNSTYELVKPTKWKIFQWKVGTLNKRILGTGSSKWDHATWYLMQDRAAA